MRRYNKLGFSIHNYFFVKSLDQVRPGGVVAFVTSRYTMDAKSTEARRYLAQRAELLGAIRLPNNAFKANAGTEVVSDILFLQKRERPVEVEPDWVYLGMSENGFAINQYFVDHPEMVLGVASSESTQYGRKDYTVAPIEGTNLSQQLREAVERLPMGIYAERAAQKILPEELDDENGVLPDPELPNNSFTVVNGTLYYKAVTGQRMQPYRCSDRERQRILDMVTIRDAVRRLIQCQLDGGSDVQVQSLQTDLNRIYDRFVEKWGYLSGRTNRRLFQENGQTHYRPFPGVGFAVFSQPMPVPGPSLSCCLQVQKILFPLNTGGIARRHAVFPHHTVARDQDEDRIAMVCNSHRSCRSGISRSGGNLLIATGLAVGNVQKCVPDTSLERAPPGIEGNVKGLSLSGKVLPYLRCGLGQITPGRRCVPVICVLCKAQRCNPLFALRDAHFSQRRMKARNSLLYIVRFPAVRYTHLCQSFPPCVIKVCRFSLRQLLLQFSKPVLKTQAGYCQRLFETFSDK